MAKKKREGITPTVRFNVFKRDRFTCQYCGKSPPSVVLELDHVIPIAEGGDDSNANLATACFDCNRGKGSRSLKDVPESVADRMVKEMELRKQVQAYNKFIATERKRAAEAAGRIGAHWCNKCCPDEQRNKWTLSTPHLQSIQQFLKHLPEEEIIEAVDIANARYPGSTFKATDERAWKYFCGICWRKIKGDSRYA